MSEIQLFEIALKEYAQKALAIPTGVVPTALGSFTDNGVEYFKKTAIKITEIDNTFTPGDHLELTGSKKLNVKIAQGPSYNDNELLNWEQIRGEFDSQLSLPNIPEVPSLAFVLNPNNVILDDKTGKVKRITEIMTAKQFFVMEMMCYLLLIKATVFSIKVLGYIIRE